MALKTVYELYTGIWRVCCYSEGKLILIFSTLQCFSKISWINMVCFLKIQRCIWSALMLATWRTKRWLGGCCSVCSSGANQCSRVSYILFSRKFWNITIIWEKNTYINRAQIISKKIYYYHEKNLEKKQNNLSEKQRFFYLPNECKMFPYYMNDIWIFIQLNTE